MNALKSYSVQTPTSREIGTAVENRDGSISVRLREVPVPFVGTFKLVVDPAARDVRPSSPPKPPPRPPPTSAPSSGAIVGKTEGPPAGWVCPVFGAGKCESPGSCAGITCLAQGPGHWSQHAKQGLKTMERGRQLSGDAVVDGHRPRIAFAKIHPPAPGAVEAYNEARRAAAELAKPLGAFVAVACSCNGSKPGHEPLGEKGSSKTCAVPNDGRNHG